MKPKLYQYAVCPFCRKVDAILGYKNVPFEAIEVHPMNKKEIAFSKDYQKVPIYVDSEGDQVNDSTPIMRHIDEEFPQNKVFTNTPDEQKWIDWSSHVLVRALPPVIYSSVSHALQAFDYITKEGKFNFFQRYFIKYSGAFAMTMVARKSAKKQNIKEPVAHLRNCFTEWSSALSAKPFHGGDKPDGADIAIYGILSSISNLPAFAYIQENKPLHQWYNRVEGLCKKKEEKWTHK